MELTYYPSPGRENTDSTLSLCRKVAEELGIEDVVIASTTGFTAKKAVEVFKGTGVKLTFVGTARERFPEPLIAELREKGCNICFSNEVKYEYPDLVKTAYRRFCQGMKVAVEIAMIAAQQGYVPTDRDIISVGKWDTAIVVKPAVSTRFEELLIRELICKPR
ncbi:MAG: pyruvate kinase alpha/beta domain-containing protein [Candidatus Bathyarchaeia archaeon]